MFIVSRNVFLAAIAVSVLAGCQTVPPRECDKGKPNLDQYGQCCGAGNPDCRQSGGGDKPGHRPDPRPQ